MDRRIRVLCLILVLCFGLLFLQLNNWQIRQSSALQATTVNQQVTAPPNEFSQPRGDIISSDGVVLAQSIPTNDQYQEQREYPLGSLTVDATGYYDQTALSDSGLEAYYDNYLTQHTAHANTLSQLLTSQTGTDNLITTLNVKLQKIAKSALDAHGPLGAVVALDPQNGDVLAMYSNPSFDPNKLASHDATAVANYYKQLQDLTNPSASPLINGVTQQTQHPGSTMKVITTSAIFDRDPAISTMTWPAISRTHLPDTNATLQNFGGETCGGNLQEILARSCDTAYALIGIKLGARNLVGEADSFGFNKVPPIDLEQYGTTEATAAQISLADLLNNAPYTAYSAIGQLDVSETVLEDALVASAIADNGVIMTPHLMSRIVSDDGTVVATYKPHPWITATSPQTADQVRTLMLGVTQLPYGTAAGTLFPISENVAAKTGTAETGALGCSADWLIATAPAGEGQVPKIAVAAEVPYQPGQVGCGETGAQVAGPIVSAVLQAGLQEGL